MTGVIRLYDIRPLRPGEVEKLAEDSSVLVIQIPGNHTGTARLDVVLVFEVGECYTRTLHLPNLVQYLRICNRMADIPRSP